MSNSCKLDEAFGLCRIYSHVLNSEGHRFIYEDIGLCSCIIITLYMCEPTMHTSSIPFLAYAGLSVFIQLCESRHGNAPEDKVKKLATSSLAMHFLAINLAVQVHAAQCISKSLILLFTSSDQ